MPLACLWRAGMGGLRRAGGLRQTAGATEARCMPLSQPPCRLNSNKSSPLTTLEYHLAEKAKLSTSVTSAAWRFPCDPGKLLSLEARLWRTLVATCWSLVLATTSWDLGSRVIT